MFGAQYDLLTGANPKDNASLVVIGCCLYTVYARAKRSPIENGPAAFVDDTINPNHSATKQ